MQIEEGISWKVVKCDFLLFGYLKWNYINKSGFFLPIASKSLILKTSKNYNFIVL